MVQDNNNRTPCSQDSLTPKTSSLRNNLKSSLMTAGLSNERKVLLMGAANAGKSSMKSVIFADCSPIETQVFAATHNIDNQSITLLNDFGLSLWDCGGQNIYFESYINRDRGVVFKNVACLIFVLELGVKEWMTPEDEENLIREAMHQQIDSLIKCLNAAKEGSSDKGVYILLHKSDLISPKNRSRILQKWKDVVFDMLKDHSVSRSNIYATSIWDETLYIAWSSIVQSLIPNYSYVEENLMKLAEVIGADDAILMEKNTFLTIAHARRSVHLKWNETKINDSNLASFEHLSTAIKAFKLSCQRGGSNFHTLHLTLSKSTIIIERLTNHLYIVLATSDPRVNIGAITLNLDIAATLFEEMGDNNNA